MMEKNLIKNLTSKNKYLYFSMNSEALKYFGGNVITIPGPGTRCGELSREHLSFKSLMGKSFIRLSTFEKTGFFDERYDVTFGFGMNFIISQEYYVFNGSGLRDDEIRDTDNLMKRILRLKGKFEYGHDILVEQLNLNLSAGVLFYTRDAKKNIKEAGINKKIIQFDLIKERESSFHSFLELDQKVRSGKVTEFDWNKNEVLLQNIK